MAPAKSAGHLLSAEALAFASNQEKSHVAKIKANRGSRYCGAWL
jgi:hypothetical protein